MKSLIVYYSLEGNCKLIAEQIKSVINADILQLKPKKEMESKGFFKYIWGGSQVVMNSKPKLEAFDVSMDDYDLIFIGTPVWAGGFAPAINTFLSENKIAGKNIALFCCYRGGKGKIFDKFRACLTGNNIIGEIKFIDPIKNNTKTALENAEKWTISCISKASNKAGD